MLSLWTAVYREHVEVVQVLLERGAIPLPRHLVSAVETGREEMVDIFLKAGVGIDEREPEWHVTALHVATIAGPSMTKFILETRPDLEAKYYGGYNTSPLDLYLTQIREINNEVVSLLIEAGAKVSPQSWVKLPSELQERYPDRCPFELSDPSFPFFQQKKTPDISEESNLEQDMGDKGFVDETNMGSSLWSLQQRYSLSTLSNRGWYTARRRFARNYRDV
jgi:hypothetical protein